MFRTTRFSLVEIIIPATVTGTNANTYFAQQPQLQTIAGNYEVVIQAIETYTNDDIDLSPITSGVPVATPAALQNAVVTFAALADDQYKFIPLASLHRIQSAAAPAPFSHTLFLLDDPIRIDWTKSYIQTLAIPAGTPFAYLFGVHYFYNDLTK